MLNASIRKETKALFADRGALLSLFVLPIIFIAVFGSLFGRSSNDVGGFEIAVWGEEHPLADAIVKDLASTRAVSFKYAKSREQLEIWVQKEDVVAGLVFPSDFTPDQHRAELVMDPALSPQIKAPLLGVLTQRYAQQAFGLTEIPTFFYEVALQGESPVKVSGFQVAVPGNAVLFGFFIALTVGLSFVGERNRGTFRRIMSAPVSRWKLLLGKLLPYFLIGVAQMMLLFGLSKLVFGLEVAGTVPGLFLMMAFVSLTAVCLGLFIGALSGTEKQVGSLGSISLLVMGLVGGCMVPRITMSGPIKSAGLFTPHAWALEGYYDALIRPSSTIISVLPNCAALLGFAVLFAALGVWRFRFE